MIKSTSLYKQIPSSEDTIFKLTGTPRSGVSVNIENFDAANNLSYKFQESNDGSDWEDKTFRTADGDEVTAFVLAPGAAHAIKLNMTTQHIRLRASGSVDAQIQISHSSTHDPAASTDLYV